MARQSQAGLTLTEMLIAISIVASMMVVLTIATRSVLQAASRVTRTASTEEDSRTSRQVLDGFLQDLSVTSLESDKRAFSGTAYAATFTIADTKSLPAIIEIKTGTEAGLSVTIHSPDSSQDPQHHLVLFEHTSALSLAYFGSQTNGNPLWHSHWDANVLPRLIRVTERKTGKIIYEYALSSQAPLVCDFDPVSRLCRRSS